MGDPIYVMSNFCFFHYEKFEINDIDDTGDG